MSGCHYLSVFYSTDGCTCAYTPNKLGQRGWISGLQLNKPACCAKSQLDTVFASEVQAPLKLLIGGFLSSLLSHSDMSHYSYALAWWNAGLLWQNQRESASLCAKNLSSLYSVGMFVCVGSQSCMNVNDPFDCTRDSLSEQNYQIMFLLSLLFSKNLFLICHLFREVSSFKNNPPPQEGSEYIMIMGELIDW